jgi:hypothetical protein
MFLEPVLVTFVFGTPQQQVQYSLSTLYRPTNSSIDQQRLGGGSGRLQCFEQQTGDLWASYQSTEALSQLPVTQGEDL